MHYLPTKISVLVLSTLVKSLSTLRFRDTPGRIQRKIWSVYGKKMDSLAFKGSTINDLGGGPEEKSKMD